MLEDFALLVLRLVVGGLLLGHGSQKAFGRFGGYGFAGTSYFMGESLRLRPAKLWTALAAASELSGGLLLVTGFLSPLGSLGVIAAMLTGAALAHWPRFWVTENGIEYPLVLAAVASALAIAGPGAFSLDAALGIQLPIVFTFVLGLGAVVIGTVIALETRAPAAPVAAGGSGIPLDKAA